MARPSARLQQSEQAAPVMPQFGAQLAEHAIGWGQSVKSVGVIAAILFAVGAGPVANAAEPNAVAYQLQERCGKRAEEVIRFRGWNPAEDGTNLQSHYNVRLNKCFAIHREAHEVAQVYWRTDTLFDVNENKEYGKVTFPINRSDPPTTCYVERKRCHSEIDWDELVRPYTEE